MSHSAYATAAELSTFTGNGIGSLPADVDRLLLRASTLIDSIPTLRSFTVDATTHLPDDGDVAAALRDAVCAQVEYWFEIGGGSQDPNTAGEAADVLRLAGPAKVGKVEIPALSKFAPRAVDVLRSSGMLRSGVEQFGSLSRASSFFEGVV